MMRHRYLIVLALVCAAAACGSDSPTAPSGPLFSSQGQGNTVIDLPATVKRLQIHGLFTGTSANFVIWCGTQLIVNEILGTSSIARSTTYDGLHQVQSPGCSLRIENSTGVIWTLVESR